MESEEIKTSLFVANHLQAKDDVEEKLEKSHQFVLNLVSGLSEREIHDSLNQAICKGSKEQEDVSFGLLYTILTEPNTASKAYRDLSFVSRDGLAIVVNKVHQILSEKFLKILEPHKLQLVWVIGEMMKNQINGLEPLLLMLLRQIAGGDLSNGNIRYTEAVVKMLKASRPWLDKNVGGLQLVVYTLLRIIEDHSGPRLKTLRQTEVEFLVQLIRDRFGDCLAIGKDFIRLLQGVFRIPELTQLWKDILYRPQSLSAQFSGLHQLLTVRTPRKFLQSRITPDMETKLAFLALKVKFGQQKRYQDWFFKQYLSQPENQTLLPDLVRFICGVIHPPNEILGSEVIPRWAIVGWLYTAGQNPVSQSNMKQALFYDWLFYQGEKDNIMNIEPAMLLMHNSVRTHPGITYILLDFICRMSTNYCPQHVNLTKQGIFNSFKAILDKRVVSSLSPILKSRMHPQLRQLIEETIPAFTTTSSRQTSTSVSSAEEKPDPNIPQSPTSTTASEKDVFSDTPSTPTPTPPTHSVSVSSEEDGGDDEAVFSDEDEEVEKPPPPPPEPPANDKKTLPPLPATSSFRPITIKEEDFELKSSSKPPPADDFDITELEEFQSLDSNLLKDNVLKLKNHREEAPEAMEAIISNIESMGDFDEEIASQLCVCLAKCVEDDLSMPVIASDHYKLSDTLAQKEIERKLESPQYVIFRSICALSKNDINLENIYVLLNGIREVDPKIGYHFLFFIKACYNDIEKFSVYEDYVSFFKDRTLKTVLIDDLKCCFDYDPHLFMYLIVEVFARFATQLVGNKEVIKMLAATIHPDEMNTLISKVLLGDLTVVGENQVGGLLATSLTWSSFEQSVLWKLIEAEETPTEMCVGVLPLLNEKKHAEALNHLLLQVRAESPQVEIIKPVLCMDIQVKISRTFSLCLFNSWCREEARELAHVLAQLLSKKNTTTGKKSKASSKCNPTLEQIVLHLNQFYTHCAEKKEMSLFQYESLRYALTQAKKNITDPAIKAMCKPLFGEFTELAERKTRKRKNNTRLTRSAKVKVKGGSSESEAESEDSDDTDDDEEDENESEEDSDDEAPAKKPPPMKKRRKTKKVSSDEDE